MSFFLSLPSSIPIYLSSIPSIPSYTPPLLHSASYTLPPFCQSCLTPFLYSTPSLPHKLLLHALLHSLFFLSDSLTFFYFPSPPFPHNRSPFLYPSYILSYTLSLSFHSLFLSHSLPPPPFPRNLSPTSHDIGNPSSYALPTLVDK